jgi:hypothetical protein
MSTVLMSKCWPLLMSPSAKSVLISLADNANDHGYCWPSLSTICRRTCLGKTAVCSALNLLERSGLITRVSEGSGKHNAYWITPDVAVQASLPLEGQPVRQANRSASRTSSADEQVNLSATRTPPVRQANPNRFASRTRPVREANTNRKEPSLEPSLNQERGAHLLAPRPPGVQSELVDTVRGHRLLPGWEPEANDQTLALNLLGPDWREALAMFRDHFTSAPGAKGRKVDWSATFRVWVRKDARARRQRREEEERPSKTMQGITALLGRKPL